MIANAIIGTMFSAKFRDHSGRSSGPEGSFFVLERQEAGD